MTPEVQFQTIQIAVEDGAAKQWELDELLKARKIAYGPYPGLTPLATVLAVRERLEQLIQSKSAQSAHQGNDISN